MSRVWNLIWIPIYKYITYILRFFNLILFPCYLWCQEVRFSHWLIVWFISPEHYHGLFVFEAEIPNGFLVYTLVLKLGLKLGLYFDFIGAEITCDAVVFLVFLPVLLIEAFPNDVLAVVYHLVMGLKMVKSFLLWKCSKKDIWMPDFWFNFSHALKSFTIGRRGELWMARILWCLELLQIIVFDVLLLG